MKKRLKPNPLDGLVTEIKYKSRWFEMSVPFHPMVDIPQKGDVSFKVLECSGIFEDCTGVLSAEKITVDVKWFGCSFVASCTSEFIDDDFVGGWTFSEPEHQITSGEAPKNVTNEDLELIFGMIIEEFLAVHMNLPISEDGMKEREAVFSMTNAIIKGEV